MLLKFEIISPFLIIDFTTDKSSFSLFLILPMQLKKLPELLLINFTNNSISFGSINGSSAWRIIIYFDLIFLAASAALLVPLKCLLLVFITLPPFFLYNLKFLNLN